MKVKVCYRMYAVFDNYDHVESGVYNDNFDIINLHLRGKDGVPITFEAEAYHLAEWCSENDFVYHLKEMTHKWEIDG